MDRQLVVFALVLVLPLIGDSADLSADDWTGWLGPARNGRVVGFESPDSWPKSLTKKWSVDVGAGYGTPLVIGDRVYQHARQGEDEVLWCLDVNNGKQIWRKSVAMPFRVRGGGEFHGKGPKACPVFADGRIFTLTIRGDLIAWSASDGKQLWRSEFGRKYAQNHPHWGASSSPIVHDDRVVIHFGNDDSGELVALNVANGRQIWTSGNEGASYSSPLIGELHGVTQVIEWNHEELAGVELSTGRKLWSYPFPHESHNQNMPTPTLHAGRVFLGAENRGLHCFEPRYDDGQWDVVKIWSQPRVGLDMSSAIENNGLLFGMSHFGLGRLFCVNPADGAILWQSEGRYGGNATFLAINEAIVALNDNGRLQVVKADGSAMQEIATWQVSDRPTWAPPVLLPGRVLVKDTNRLMLLSFQTAR